MKQESIMKLFSKVMILGALSSVSCIAMDGGGDQGVSLDDLKNKSAETLADPRYNLDVNLDELLGSQANKIEGLRIKRKVLQAQKIRTEHMKMQPGVIEDIVSKGQEDERQIREHIGSGFDKLIESEIIIQEIDKILTSILKDLEEYMRTSMSAQEVGRAINERLNALKELYRQIGERGQEKEKIIEELESMISEVVDDTGDRQKNIREIEQLLLLLKGVAPEKQPVKHVGSEVIDHEQVDDLIIPEDRGLTWEEWLEQQRQASNIGDIKQPTRGYEDESSIVLEPEYKEGPDLSFYEEDIVLSVDELKKLRFDITQKRLEDPGTVWRCVENVCSWVTFGKIGRTSEEIDREIEQRRIALLEASERSIVSILRHYHPELSKEELSAWLAQARKEISRYLDRVERYLKRVDKMLREKEFDQIGLQDLLAKMGRLKEEDRQHIEEQRRLEEEKQRLAWETFKRQQRQFERQSRTFSNFPRGHYPYNIPQTSPEPVQQPSIQDIPEHHTQTPSRWDDPMTNPLHPAWGRDSY